MKRIAVLGSTGSIGTQTLEIVRTNKDIKITALAAGNNIELLENRSGNSNRRLPQCGMRKKPQS